MFASDREIAHLVGGVIRTRRSVSKATTYSYSVAERLTDLCLLELQASTAEPNLTIKFLENTSCIVETGEKF